MMQSPPVRLNTVVEQLSNGHYFIYDLDGGQQDFAPDSPDWFAWLAGHTSFHFTCKDGHFSARQEKKQRGASYWYAYRRASHHRYKHYLGTTETLTVAKLEQTARALHDEALGATSDKEVLNTSASHPGPEELTLGPLTFRWREEVLRIKTPTESHYLNKAQTAALFGYLYDQRRTILKKS